MFQVGPTSIQGKVNKEINRGNIRPSSSLKLKNEEKSPLRFDFGFVCFIFFFFFFSFLLRVCLEITYLTKIEKILLKIL